MPSVAQTRPDDDSGGVSPQVKALPRPLMNVAEVAQYLGKSTKYVRQHAALFGGMRVGKEWRFDDAGIAAGLESLRAPAANAEAPAESTPIISAVSARRFARQRRLA